MIETPTAPRHVVAIIGASVAGAEAARVLADAGVSVVVIEQHARPYGRIDDGLPRWHVDQRRREARKIDERLDRPGVELVPCTALGKDFAVPQLLAWGASGVLLATGARRDRKLPVKDIERFVDRGLVYQGALVHWFVHRANPRHDTPWYVVPDGALIVGGGRGSLDVVKIAMLESTRRALLEEHGIQLDLDAAQREGLRTHLTRIGHSFASVGLEGCRLIYRRDAEDMPIVPMPEGASDEVRERVRKERKALLDRTLAEWGARFEGRVMPREPIAQGDQLVGLRCLRCDVEGKRAYPIDDSWFDLRAGLVIGAIGTVPQEFPGMVLDGECYRQVGEDGAPRGEGAGVFGAGSVVRDATGARVTLRHSTEVARHLLDRYLPTVPPLAPGRQQHIVDIVRARQEEVGYRDYASWIHQVSPLGRS